MLKAKVNIEENPSSSLRENSHETTFTTSTATGLGTHGLFSSSSGSASCSSLLSDTIINRRTQPGAYSVGNTGGSVTTLAHGPDARSVAINNIQMNSVTTAHTNSASVATCILGVTERSPAVYPITVNDNSFSQSSSTATSSSSNFGGPTAIASGNQISPGSNLTVFAVGGNATIHLHGSTAISSTSSASSNFFSAATNHNAKLETFRTQLNSFYQQQAYISYLFYDVSAIPISQAPRLALVLECEQRDKEQQSNNSHKDNKTELIKDQRINSFEDIYGNKKPIELEKLFDKHDEKDIASNRILIVGRAGIGKTTLCQFIAYQWSQRKLWQDKYDWVFWIPLRNLSKRYYAHKDKITLAEVIYQECCPSEDDDDSGISLVGIQQLLKNKEKKTKILLLLDGYDEIASLDKEDTAIGNVIKQVLCWEQVMVTTRPYAIPDNQHIRGYKRLENIGFLDEDIYDYVKKFFVAINRPTRADECLMFLKQNPLVWGTAHIPITLELICSAWNEKRESGVGLSGQLSMTELYEELVYKLGKRYLQKRSQNPLDTKVLAKLSPEAALEKCRHVRAFLGELAFEVSKRSDSRILIDTSLIGPLRKKHEKSNPSLFDDILESHFLKSTGNQKNISEQSFYFVHLTFQEYFAASHIVERFKQNDPNIFRFIKEHKYVQSWEVTCWFVAGLLKDNLNNLEKFFDILEDEPRDLIELYHQVLLIRCMDECQLQVAEVRKDVFIKNLCHWMNLKSQSCTAVTTACLETISRYLGLSSRVWNLPKLIQLLSECSEIIINESNNRLGTLQKIYLLSQYNFLPEKLLLALVDLLKDKEEKVEINAARVLRNYEELPMDIVSRLVKLLKDENERVKSSAAFVLEKQATLPEATVNTLVELLNDKDQSVRSVAVRVLRERKILCVAAVNKLVRILQDKNNEVRDAAASVLGNQPALPETTANMLVELLNDKEEYVRNVVTRVLGEQKILRVSTVNKLVMLLQVERNNVKRAAARALRKQAALPDVTLRMLLTLQDERGFLERAAARILGEQTVLPEDIIRKLVELLKDKAWVVRDTAALGLRKQTALSPDNINDLIELLKKHKTWGVSNAAAAVLGNQPSLPQNSVKALEELLKDKNSCVREAAAVVLGNQAVLPETTTNMLVELLNDKEDYVRNVVTKILVKHKKLSVSTVNNMVDLLNNYKRGLHISTAAASAAAEVLASQTSLSDDNIRVLEGLLEDGAWTVRNAAALALCQCNSLSDKTISILVGLLKDKEWYVRSKAAKVLENQLSLSKTTNILLGNLLKDEWEHVRNIVAEVLRQQSLTRVVAIITSDIKATGSLTISLLFPLVIKSLFYKLPIFCDIAENKIIVGNLDNIICFSNEKDMDEFIRHLNIIFHQLIGNHFAPEAVLSPVVGFSNHNDDDNDNDVTPGHDKSPHYNIGYR